MAGRQRSTDEIVSVSQILDPSNSRSLSKVLSGHARDDLDMAEKLLQSVAVNSSGEKDEELENEVPNMWTLDYIGLYSQYAAAGLLYGTSGTWYPFCSYVYDGPSNLCANAKNIVFFAWGFKLFFAIITDTIRPFGLRRKPWMIFGWTGVLIIHIILTIFAQSFSAEAWLGAQLGAQFMMMFANVPADGYSVELGHMEPVEQRGQIMATGQRIRFTFCIVAGILQTFLVNGPSTSSSDCPISWSECWSWGLNVNGFYGLLTAFLIVLYVPLWYLKEPDASRYPHHTVTGLFTELWITMQNLTTFNVIVFVIGSGLFTVVTNAANIMLQYYVINLTNFQAGIDTITTYFGLVFAIYLFQTYLINRNWRYSEYGSIFVCSLLGLVWIPAYYNLGNTRNAWYTIFIDLDTQFAQGIVQVLFAMCVIELAKKGQEATTFELVTTLANTASTLGSIMAVQLLTPFKAAGCTSDDGCPTDTVDITSVEAYTHSNGPYRFTMYCIMLQCLGIAAGTIFIRYLPSGKEQCQEWKEIGEQAGEESGKLRGYIVAIVSILFISYGLIVSVLLLDVETSCLQAVGGEGC